MICPVSTKWYTNPRIPSGRLLILALTELCERSDSACFEACDRTEEDDEEEAEGIGLTDGLGSRKRSDCSRVCVRRI